MRYQNTSKNNYLGLLKTLFMAGLLHAYTPSYATVSWMQASLYGGLSRTQTEIGKLHVSRSESDYLTPNNNTDFTQGVGIARAFKMHGLLSQIALGVNYFYFSTQLKGYVNVYSNPAFSNYTYRLGLRTNRLMVDGKFEFQSIWQGVTPYLHVAIGGANIATTYNGKPNTAEMIHNGQINLAKNTTTNVTYSLGAGIKKHVSKHVAVLISYLYTDFGKSISSITSDQIVLQRPLQTTLATNTALIGLRYTFDNV